MRSIDMYTEIEYRNELYHHGIKGMKWGVRRFQNADGTYTESGRQHYGFGDRRRRTDMPYEEARKKARESGKFRNFIEKRKRAKAQKVLNKLNSMSGSRLKRMSANQRQSLESAKAYWSAVANGKTPSQNRNIIKRYYDKKRMSSAPARVASNVASNIALGTAIEVGKHYVVKKTNTGYYPINIRKIARNATVGVGRSFVTDELLNKILGHY